MTGPTGLVSAAVQEIQAEAEPLGLAWKMLIGTVLSGGNPTTVTLLLDGDNLVPVKGVSMIGPLDTGARVYVVSVPPAGLYVSGYAVNSGLKLTSSQLAVASADLTLGASPGVVIPGLSVAVTVAGAARYKAVGVIDFDETVLGTTLGVGKLNLDSVEDPSAILFEMSSINDRATVIQQWAGNLAAGSHTFELFAYRISASGTQVARQIHSTLSVDVYE